ncbi:FHA domain-containing serine/threonine-protein kinase, partial [Deinococcus sp. 23YEL01]|uniref:FHA domain-containing serine/threonine-protein kinase n=1 Tax=Deinococcus sp. 23YEL01 TaxID=2745871 RepID=UPI001E57FB24
MTDTTTFHHYQLGRPLGSGWLGPVHVAADLDENREVALRILDDTSSGQSFLIMQLERLLLKVHSLRHAHILPTEPLQQRDRRAFYAMELGRQGSARQLLQGQARSAQPLPIVTATDLIRQAAAGLAHAHDQGLMHGNLKPENLILQPGRALLGQTGYVTQLSDFGLAELRAGSYGTHDRAVVNALAYMSPEQCRGVRNELRTDLYALGLILYELVTGLVPFEIRDAAEALEKHQHVAPRVPSLLRPDLPPALEEVILTCLAKDPQDRYASARALEAALQEVLNALMPGGPEPTLRLSALPVLPPAPSLDGQQSGPETRLLVFSERHELLRTQAVTAPSLTVGRAPDNAVVLEHIGVSRHHLNVEFTGGQAHVTELTATNGTVMDGLPLTPMTRLRWPARTPLYLRPYWLVLLDPVQAPAPPRIVVKPEQDRVTLVPGTPFTLHLLLANTGPTVDHFRVSLDGLPPEWVQDAHGEVQLNPGMQGHTTLTLLAPRDSA